ncbi:hypothetical protein [Ferroacidibacillus organovorans]|uniref:Uncharacterized protein n=1 Tax=Ferroacidibacillus organovorans TaxID=1765683 RepID=A0A124IWF6_9BACL|nr:hypothetical protein [Ferroacidibacillus organovorans]KUO97246.1 hypothetical protein ATW55_11670 [Ferroacidibacillus organovorans]
MSILNRIRTILAGERYCSDEHLEGYHRIGQDVYVLEMELLDATEPHAKAIARAARCFQVMGDALLQDAREDDQKRSVASITHEQAEVLYGRIPDLMVAARQEAAFAGSARVSLPIRLGKRVESGHTCPLEHFIGLQRAADDLESLLSSKIQLARLEGDKFKESILLAEEARTRRRTGDSTVGRLTEGKKVPADLHEEAEESYWTALSSYLLVAQGLEDPSVLSHPARVSSVKSKLDSEDRWRITSESAKREIRRSGEWQIAERDLDEFWESHRLTQEEREYEATVENLLRSGDIVENGYWYCCPFQSCYRVVQGPVHVVGHTVKQHHAFVWEYGEDGARSHFIQVESFNRADSRQYCGDEDK